MAQLANTFDHYDAVGNREDLTDLISNISPNETPFFTRARKGKAKAVLHEWQTDALAAAITTNAQITGDEAAFDAVTPTKRIGNRTQIMRKTCVIADTQEVVDKAGRKSEKAYQSMKKGKELKRDIEATLLTNQAASAGDSTTAAKMGSLLAFLYTNTDFATNGVDPVYTTVPDDPRTDGTQRAFTEAMVADVAEAAWVAGADPSIIMLNAFQKRAFSAFDGIAAIRSMVKGEEQATITGAADVYVGDFGKLTTVPNRFMRTRDALILDMDFVEVDFLRPIKTVDLAKTGDSHKWMIITELTLKVKNEAALGGIFDLTDA